MKAYKKHALRLCAGVVATASLFSVPIHSHLAVAAEEQIAMMPVPATISKGIQQLAKLLPELQNSTAVYQGPVDGPGVSGDSVSFVLKTNGADEAVSRAIFDPQNGQLLVLDLQPKAPDQTQAWKLTDESAKEKAAAFLQNLHPHGKFYTAGSVSHEEGKATVRFVRKHNQVALTDPYDCFVTVDGTGRVIGYRTHNGAMYETLDPQGMPSAQRVMSEATAAQRYADSKPLELVYLLDEKAGAEAESDSAKQPTAQLVYALKGGVVKGPHTGGALDAMSGKPLANAAQQGQTVSVTGKATYASLKREDSVKAFAKEITGAELDKLPLISYADEQTQTRLYIWGVFGKEQKDEEKVYSLGQFPEDVKSDQKLHVLVEVDEQTGQLVRMSRHDGTDPRKPTDKERDLKTAVSWMERLLPTGSHEFRLKDEGDEEFSIWVADPLREGVPVYQKGQSKQQGAFVVQVNPLNGSILSLSRASAEDAVYPERGKAISEQAALAALLKAYPLELAYVKTQADAEKEAEWKLAYDLSFRQTKQHCFCGVESKVDTTVYVDALTGKVITEE
ncbi:hypothetical protein KDJ56_19815 [Brevibacillus composti]|uniref:YcdB/YcdC repeated domain-containing protein n=1 Tax=Brevibacillus composti TaxID=2796470 RepID=A0A7T5JND4_9BACL|nr:YcdB/YcdC domain-containing protein [Brevibacillus composti]QQE74069.1 hypothetical protein JD108_19880 [Brevibacillus composti]QUO41153.1 hypothetical protein KDJ56_19815 [Brevibacillus composti]